MNFRPTSEQDVDINLTPLIDVVFLLLIFFMVSTTFIKESEIDLTLPEASEEVHEDPLDKIEVSIDREGNVFINEMALINSKLITIRQALRDARTNDGDPVVIIRADAQASHQTVVDVMDAARQANLYRITFPTRLREQE